MMLEYKQLLAEQVPPGSTVVQHRFIDVDYQRWPFDVAS